MKAPKYRFSHLSTAHILLQSKESFQMSFIQDFFKENGELSAKLDGYETRPQQIQMAEAVSNAIKKDRNLIVEAGTGIGKTLAYLVPLILWALNENGRIVISTYTKALQNQIYIKDLPFLKEVLNKKIKYALCLGSENYVCLRKAQKMAKSALRSKDSNNTQIKEINEWLLKTDSGILSDLDFVPEPYVRNHFSRETYLCLGRRCEFYRDCYYMKARFQQSKAHVLIVNHSLLFADLVSGTKVLPDFHALVLDEAHTVEDVATSYFGKAVSVSAVKFLSRQILNFFDDKKKGKAALNQLAEEKSKVREKLKCLDSDADILQKNSEITFGGLENSVNLDRNDFYDCNLSNGLLDLSEYLFEVIEKILDADVEAEINAFAERSRDAGKSLEFVFGPKRKNYVYWVNIEQYKKEIDYKFCATPVQIGDEMRGYLFEKISPVILTSATLTSDNNKKRNFNFLKERLGVDDCDELSLDSPFDYKNNVIIYAPEGIPDPNSDFNAYKQQVSEYILSLFDVLGGRMFALFTSYQMLNSVSAIIKEKLHEKNVLKQGDMPRYVLLDVFKRNSDCILMGTTTFWQGVDVPGSSLECVIITKFPFASPSNPVIASRIEAVRDRGQNPFIEYQLPQAIILFKQGFGRLVRSQTDRGVVAVLDPRVYTKFYGKTFLNALPKCRRTSQISDISEFFNS